MGMIVQLLRVQRHPVAWDVFRPFAHAVPQHAGRVRWRLVRSRIHMGIYWGFLEGTEHSIEGVVMDGVLEPVANHTGRAGFAIAPGDTRQEVIDRACEVVDRALVKTSRL